MSTLSLGLHYDLPESIYRCDAGLSQSLLKAFGTARSPAHFKYDQEHPPDPNSPARASIRIGNYVDYSLFRPDQLAIKQAVWPGERRGKDWEAFKEANEGKEILNKTEREMACGCIGAIAVHEDAQRILKVCDSQVCAIAETQSRRFRMKGLIDLLPDPASCDPLLLGYAFDLKTSSDASPEAFSRSCYDYGYDVQAAFYMDILNLLGRPVQNFGFIVVENKPPFAVKIHYLVRESQIIRRARQKYDGWMIGYINCLADNFWPGYTSGWSEIQYRPWMLRDDEGAGDSLQ